METLFFNSKETKYGYTTALHIYRVSGDRILVVQSSIQTMNKDMLENSRTLLPSNSGIIDLCNRAKMAGLEVKTPEPDYSSIPYDLTEEEFLSLGARLAPSPDPEKGIVWNLEEIVPINRDSVIDDNGECVERMYTDVKMTDGVVVRAVFSGPTTVPANLSGREEDVPSEVIALVLRQQDEERKKYDENMKKVNAHRIEELKACLAQAGLLEEKQ